jgi:signal transduction histidine kinase
MTPHLFDRRALWFGILSSVLVICSLGAAFTWLYDRVGQILDVEIHEALQRDLKVSGASYRDGGRAGLMAGMRRRFVALPSGRIAVYYDERGRLLLSNHSALSKSLPLEQLPVDGTRVIEHAGSHVILASQLFPDGSKLVLGQDVIWRNQLSQTLISAAFVATFCALLAAGLFGWRFNRYMIQRIDAIAAAARGIMRGQMEARAPVGQRLDAIGEFSQVFNEMLDRNEALLTGMRTVTESLAHDLRAPLMRMERAIGMSRRAPTPEARDVFLREAEGEAQRTLRTFNALIDLARAEAGLARGAMQRTDLATLVHDVVELYEPLAVEKGQRLIVSIIAATAIVHRQILMQALGNLLENAIKFSLAGAELNLALEPARPGAGPAFVITDRGPGIPENAREQALRPFVRLESAVGTSGSGLGLAIAAAVARLHGGRLVLQDANPGLIVRLELGVDAASGPPPVRPQAPTPTPSAATPA